MTPIKLTRIERVIAVVPESARGPGWSNQLFWVFILNEYSGRLRTESIQLKDAPAGLQWLFDVGEAAHKALVSAVPVEKEK